MDILVMILIPPVTLGVLIGMAVLVYKLDKKINKRKGGK